MTAADELLDGARAIVETPALHTRGWWARAAAVLARQALELGVAERLEARGAAPARASFTAQLVALPAVVEPALAGRVWATWAALSAATHFQGYELPPTAGELRGWIAVVAELVADRPAGR